jgi:hypothetical protein
MQRHLILVCHAADGHFADGDRKGICRVLEHSATITDVTSLGRERYALICADGGRVELHAAGLEGNRSFHKMELFLDSDEWTADVLNLILELMRAGGFGLMDGLDAPQFIVTQPQQVKYFPCLPEPPLLVRSTHDLGHTIGLPIAS